MKRKQEGVVGLVLIAIVIVAAVLFFRPKSLESALGKGFVSTDVTEITALLVPVGGEEITVEILPTDQAFPSLLALLQTPTYSFTFSKQEEAPLNVQVTLTLSNRQGEVWEYHFQGGKLIEAGVPGAWKSYQISGGQESQQKILDFLLEQTEG